MYAAIRTFSVTSILLGLTATSVLAQTVERPRTVVARTLTVSADPCQSGLLSLATTATKLPEAIALQRLSNELDLIAGAYGMAATGPRRESNNSALMVLRRKADSLTFEANRIAVIMPVALSESNQRLQESDQRLAESKIRLQESERRLHESNTRIAESDVRLQRARSALNSSVRELSNEVDEIVRQITPSSAASEPAGYFGITLTGVPMRQLGPSSYTVSYCDYPVVESVDPGSPAARAGMSSGDTLLSFNGLDVRKHAVDYTSLLTPGSKIMVRTRSRGTERTHEVTVTPRSGLHPTRVSVRGRVVVQNPNKARSLNSVFPSTGTVAMNRSITVAGAQILNLSEEQRKFQQLSTGVVVVRVFRGSPASEGGLREGDFIREVNWTSVKNIDDIMTILDETDQHSSVSFTVVRVDGRERDVIVWW